MDLRTRIALIGLGSDSRRDDGVGRAVVEALRARAFERRLPPEVGLETCNGEPARLVGLWHDADLAVVVTCAHAYPCEPGRVVRREFDAEDFALPMRGEPHSRVLSEAVELSRLLGRLPHRLVVYAVQGADSSLGTGLSPTLAAMVDRLADCVEQELVREWTPVAAVRPCHS
ncbi:hydrogenase maturation protease [Streptomyces wuyuanensis]|uniref:Hydrogenase maturation protease n=1 Tax=Streptomyces wuyuanensis TaxID=1196353 RepID=A0A1G9PWS8_9ACTN|nr:hydrogenase maturation protease [Streptomyces wuyuanensis]SDM02941.1 hydrogenase maturation protease [Streptomyces wuyuanensis]